MSFRVTLLGFVQGCLKRRAELAGVERTLTEDRLLLLSGGEPGGGFKGDFSLLGGLGDDVTGSFDHRVCDGAGGAKFVNLVKGYLENPTRLLS